MFNKPVFEYCEDNITPERHDVMLEPPSPIWSKYANLPLHYTNKIGNSERNLNNKS